MIGPKLTPQEQVMADTIIKQMGLNPGEYADDVDYTLNKDYEAHEDFYNNSNVVAKPEFVKLKEKQTEARRRGVSVQGDLNPIGDKIIVKMYPADETKTKTGIYIANLKPVNRDNQKCQVVKTKNSEDYDVGDDILVDLRYVKHRYFQDGFTHLVMSPKGVLAVYG
jgi:co-chaperonin GroES (HSP10)